MYENSLLGFSSSNSILVRVWPCVYIMTKKTRPDDFPAVLRCCHKICSDFFINVLKKLTLLAAVEIHTKKCQLLVRKNEEVSKQNGLPM